MKASPQASEKKPALKGSGRAHVRGAAASLFESFSAFNILKSGPDSETAVDRNSNQLALRAQRPPVVQAKLKVGSANDSFEQEADRMAEAVTADAAPGTATPSVVSIQRKSSTASGDAPAAPAGVERVAAAPGQPLSSEARAYFEPRFGRDFSGVRVHTDSSAAEATNSINAEAFTTGNNIAFAQGNYAPETEPGRKLLAHELTHVVQQESGRAQAVQRFEGPEHQDLGDRYLDELLTFLQTEKGKKWAGQLGYDRDTLVKQIKADPQFKGKKIQLGQNLNAETGNVERVRLTPGEIISLMGDMYGTVDDLSKAPKSEIKKILKIMQGEREGTIADAGKQFEEVTGGRYLKLAQKNDAHFARLNRAEWRRLHEEALAAAKKAQKNGDKEGLQRALLIDAAGGHFLTDAFAAGHLFDKTELLTAITLHLATHTPKTQSPEMQGYIGIVSLSGKLPQVVLKTIHDRMNAEGFEVSNGAGMKWKTFGDDHLKTAENTQRVAALAVFLSRQQVHKAYEGKSLDPDAIEKLMPNEDSVKKATLKAISLIPQAVAEVEGTLYQNRSMAPTQFGSIFGPIIESNLNTIGSPGREKQILQIIDGAREIGIRGPVIAPSFTLFDWK